MSLSLAALNAQAHHRPGHLRAVPGAAVRPAPAPARAAATAAPDAGSLTQSVLPNGLRLLVWYDPDLASEDLCLSVGVGSALDMERKQGAAGLVADIVSTGHSDGRSALELSRIWEQSVRDQLEAKR